MRRVLVLFLSLVVVMLLSCRKEKTTWDSDWSIPLVHGNLTMSDLLPPEFIETNTEDYLSLVYHDTAFSFKLDTLVKFPDTTIVSWLDLVLFSFLTISPTYNVTDVQSEEFDIGDVFFKRIIAKSGEASIEISTPWPGKSKMITSFPTFYQPETKKIPRETEDPPGPS
ncbi:hypothetical protein JYT21_00080 [bacterium AH-315-B15]|nr:hypothetical protein [bacterium AH-315-B15]